MIDMRDDGKISDMGNVGHRSDLIALKEAQKQQYKRVTAFLYTKILLNTAFIDDAACRFLVFCLFITFANHYSDYLGRT